LSRPEIEIDWNRVDQMLIEGCIGTEIAAKFCMHPDTLYRRVEEKFKMGFTAYSTEKRSIGDYLLRQKQFHKAIEGDNTLLIWLGKNRLKQKENPDQIEFNNAIAEKFDSVMNLLTKSQVSDLSMAESNISNADKSMLETGEDIA